MTPNLFDATAILADIDLLYDQYAPGDIDREKLDILRSSVDYIKFVSTAARATEDKIYSFISDLHGDKLFWDNIRGPLDNLVRLPCADDLRFNSTTLYLLVRAIRPRVIVEAGVAHGKSSSYLLAALNHNSYGELVSFDLPAKGEKAIDCSNTNLYGMAPGNIVPSYLRDNWKLEITNSLEGIRSLAPSDEETLFFHDSLHTYKHAKGEIELMEKRFNLIGVIMDNYDMECGLALQSYAVERGLQLSVCKDLGICISDY